MHFVIDWIKVLCIRIQTELEFNNKDFTITMAYNGKYMENVKIIVTAHNWGHHQKFMADCMADHCRWKLIAIDKQQIKYSSDLISFTRM